MSVGDTVAYWDEGVKKYGVVLKKETTSGGSLRLTLANGWLRTVILVA